MLRDAGCTRSSTGMNSQSQSRGEAPKLVRIKEHKQGESLGWLVCMFFPGGNEAEKQICWLKGVSGALGRSFSCLALGWAGQTSAWGRAKERKQVCEFGLHWLLVAHERYS